MAGFDFLAYKEPPPPYTSPQPHRARLYDPPSYESMRADHGLQPDGPEAGSGSYNEAATLSPMQSDAAVSETSEAGFYSRV